MIRDGTENDLSNRFRDLRYVRENRFRDLCERDLRYGRKNRFRDLCERDLLNIENDFRKDESEVKIPVKKETVKKENIIIIEGEIL